MAAVEVFWLSKANPLHWRIETGLGSAAATITQDPEFPPVVPDMNFLSEDLQSFGGDICYSTPEQVCHQFLCDDETDLQFRYVRTGYSPWLFWFTPVPVGDIPVMNLYANPTDMDEAGSTFHADIDFTDFDCPSCLQFALFSIEDSATTSNLFTDGEDGTFENPGGVTDIYTGGVLGNMNSVAQSNAQAHSGTFSAIVTAPVSPGTKNKLIINGGTAIGLIANTAYYAEAWVYLDAGSPFVSGAGEIGFSPTFSGGYSSLIGSDVGWTDAVILDQENWTSADGTGVWKKITVTFMVNTDTTGHLDIISSVVPTGNGIVYVDDVILKRLTTAREATSERICLVSESCGSVGVTYGAIPGDEHPQFGLNYSNTLPITNTFFTRIPKCSWMQFQMNDPDFNSDETSTDNSGRMVKSNLVKVNRFRTGQIPWWMAEKLPMWMKHDKVTIQLDSLSIAAGNPLLSIDYICRTENFVPKWSEVENSRSLMCSVEWDMRPKYYQYQNNNCGPE